MISNHNIKFKHNIPKTTIRFSFPVLLAKLLKLNIVNQDVILHNFYTARRASSASNRGNGGNVSNTCIVARSVQYDFSSVIQKSRFSRSPTLVCTFCARAQNSTNDLAIRPSAEWQDTGKNRGVAPPAGALLVVGQSP